LGAWDATTKAPTIAMDAFLIDPANPPKLTIIATFKVSMKESGMNTSKGVYLLGSQTGWTFTPMTHEGDSLYSVTLKLVEGDTAVYYFVTTNSWDNYKNYREPAIPNECGDMAIVGWAGDRLLIVPAKDTTVSYAWGKCSLPIKTGIFGIKKNDEKFLVYPNPAKRIINIILPATTNENTTIEFSDFSGKAILKHTFEKGSRSISISTEAFARGIYFMKIYMNSYVIAYEKCIIE